MKTITKIIAATVAMLAAASTMNAQVTITQSEYVNEPRVPMVLSVENGYIAVAFDMTLGEKFIKSNQISVITPMFVFGENTQNLPSLVIQGDRYSAIAKERARFDKIEIPVDDIYKVVQYTGDDMAVHYQQLVKYDPRLKGAVLKLNCKTYKICGSLVADNNSDLAEGVPEYSGFIKDNPIAYYFPNRVSGNFTYDFQNRSVFKLNKKVIDMNAFTEYGYNDMKAEVEKLKANKDVKFTSLEITTAASPDGPLKHNKVLAEARANAIEAYLIKDLGLEGDLMDKHWIDENWAAFEDELPKSGLDNQSEIMDIINSNADLDARERLMWRLPNWKAILNIFQELRNCRIVIDYTTREYYPDEMIIEGRDMAVVGMNDNDMDVSVANTEKFYNAEPNSINNINNMMVALTEAGKYAEAKKFADRIPMKNIPALMANNKGVLFLYLGDHNRAKTMFEIAMASNIPLADYNLGVMYLMDENPEEASKLLNKYNDVNSMIANLDKGDNKEAARNTHMNDDSGEYCYIRSMAYAKDGYDQLALDALEEAVAFDAGYKAMAANEAEFVRFHNCERFQAITGYLPTPAPAKFMTKCEMRKAARAAKKEARAAEKAAEQAADDAEKAAKQAAKDAEKAAKQAAKETGETAVETVETAGDNAKAEARAAEKAAKEEARAAKAAAKEAARAAKAAAKEAGNEVVETAAETVTDTVTETADNTAASLFERAVAYANDRLDTLALDALEQAVKMDSSLKKKALSQSEFSRYAKNVRFIEITK
jgi:hypothetical protein